MMTIYLGLTALGAAVTAPEGTSADAWYWDRSLRDFGPKYCSIEFDKKSRRPLPPDPYCSAPTQPPPLAAAWPWQVIGKNAKLNRRRDTFVSEISEFRHRRRD